MQWNNTTTHKCGEVWGVLHTIYRSLGSLPDNKTPVELKRTTAEEICDFGKSILDNESIWLSLPNQIPNCTEGTGSQSKEALREGLRNILNQCR